MANHAEDWYITYNADSLRSDSFIRNFCLIWYYEIQGEINSVCTV